MSRGGDHGDHDGAEVGGQSSGDDHDLSDFAERGLVGFTITNGVVTGATVVRGTTTVAVSLPTNATFTVGSGTVTETLTTTNATTVITYSAVAGTTNYVVSSEQTTVTTPTTVDAEGETSGYSFTVSGGVVTAVTKTSIEGTTTHTHVVPILPSTIFTAAADGSVTETLVHGNEVETIRFVQPTAGGLYAVASETATFIPIGSATTALSVDADDRFIFTTSGSTVTQVQKVSAAGVATTFTPDSHTTFQVLAPGFVEEIHTYGSRTSYTVFYADPASNGVYTEVAHGSGATVDLVGLQTQLTQIPAALLAGL